MVDHHEMSQAYMRAVKHEAASLRKDNLALTAQLNDSEILLDAMATTLYLFLYSSPSIPEISEAKDLYKMWLARRESGM